MKTHFHTLLGIVAGLALVGQTQAACPAGLANPVFFLDGTHWAFLTEDGALGDAQIGIFAATAQAPTSRNPYYSGLLSGTETSNTAGTVIVHQQFSGRYQVNDTCTGGTLFFNANGNGFQFAFVVAGPNKLYLLSESTDVNGQPGPIPEVGTIKSPQANAGGRALNNGVGPLAGNRGVASRLAGTPQCPAGTPALNLLAGNWSFLTEDFASASIGTFAAQPQASAYNGVLKITQTTSGGGFLAIDEAFNGTYQVEPDCSGGSLTMPYGGDGFQYEFVFANATTIYMVSSNTGFYSNTQGVYRGRHGTAVMTP